MTFSPQQEYSKRTQAYIRTTWNNTEGEEPVGPSTCASDVFSEAKFNLLEPIKDAEIQKTQAPFWDIVVSLVS